MKKKKKEPFPYFNPDGSLGHDPILYPLLEEEIINRNIPATAVITDSFPYNEIEKAILQMGFDKKAEGVYHKHIKEIAPYIVLFYDKLQHSIRIIIEGYKSENEVVSGFYVTSKSDLYFLLSHLIPIYYYVSDISVFDVEFDQGIYHVINKKS